MRAAPRASLGLVVVIIGITMIGSLTRVAEPAPLCYAAACKAPNPYCGPQYRTAAVDVDHYASAWTLPVEPGTSETLTVTAYWNNNSLPCQELADNAYVTVSWSGSAWVLSNITTSPNITGFSICSTGNECGSPPAHAYDYRLIAQVNDPLPGPYNLRAVVFATTAIDDGRVLDPSACTLGAAVSPTSQSFSATDFGAFECGLSCTNSGASMTILYR